MSHDDSDARKDNLPAVNFSSHTRAEEMVRIGEAATAATIGDLRNMLHRLDAELFPELIQGTMQNKIAYPRPLAA